MELMSQYLTKEMVIAIPVAFVIQRNQQETGAIKDFSYKFGIVYGINIAADGVAKRGAKALKQRHAQHYHPLLRR